MREQIDDGFVERVPIRDYCVVTGNHDIPLYDQMLAQKLALEAATDQFFAVANVMEPQRLITMRPPGVDVIPIDVNFEDILANRPAYIRPRRQGV